MTLREVAIADAAALTVHPAAALFPSMADEELRALAEDIRVNGLGWPIVVKDGQILDGRNRLRACEIAGVAPTFVEWSGTGSVNAWVFSANLHRRHLTTAQRALLAARAVPIFEADAAKRQARGRAAADDAKGRARAKAAEAFGVAHGTVANAQRVLAHGVPELRRAVEEGTASVSAAAAVAALPPDEQRRLVRDKEVTARARRQREATRVERATPSKAAAKKAPAPTLVRETAAPSGSPRGEARVPSPNLKTDEGFVPEGDDASADAWGPAANDMTLTGDVDDVAGAEGAHGPLEPIAVAPLRERLKATRTPAEDREHLALIVATLTSVLDAWRSACIAWDFRGCVHMGPAIVRSSEIARGLSHVQAALREVVDVCRAEAS